MRRYTFALCLTAVCAAADLPKLPPETMEWIDGARALPPEFRADSLLALSASARIADRAWKMALTEEAFTAASHAQLPHRYSCQVPVDVRQCMETYDFGLDGLTLQTRAVEAMLDLDPAAARDLFGRIAPPHAENPGCENVNPPDISAYYKTAGAVFERGFSPELRRKEEDIQYLETVISTMNSPAGVAPVLQMLSAAKVSAERRRALLSRFAVTLDTVAGSDRLYAGWEWALVPAVTPETTEPRRIPRPLLPEVREAALFVPALRAYIVRQLGGERCTDRMGQAGRLPLSAARFNALAAQLDPAALTYQPITQDEVKPGKDGGTYKYTLPWQSPRSKEVLAAQKWLNHGNRDLPDSQRFWTLEERSTPEWNARYEDTMKLIAGWKESEENSPEEYFQLAASAYGQMAALVPPGPARDNAMSVFLNFLETRYSAIGSRNYWFAQVKFLLNRIRSGKDEDDRRWLIESLQRSANPVIAFYARMAAGS